jgi:hypothetical protein
MKSKINLFFISIMILMSFSLFAQTELKYEKTDIRLCYN